MPAEVDDSVRKYIKNKKINQLVNGIVGGLFEFKPPNPSQFLIEFLRSPDSLSRINSKGVDFIEILVASQEKAQIKSEFEEKSPVTADAGFERDEELCAHLNAWTWTDTQQPVNQRRKSMFSVTSLESLLPERFKASAKSKETDNEDEGDNYRVAPTKEIDNRASEMLRRRYSTIDRRGAVSSESINDKVQQAPRLIIPKTKDEKIRLQHAISANPLLTHLDQDEREIIFDAMFERTYDAGEVIIKQGDSGDNFYVVDSGECDIYVSKNQTQVVPGVPANYGQKVATVSAGGSFGELALIHGTPRAATVIAHVDTRLWGIDRLTYRRVLMQATQKKRKLYSEFLEKVPLLANLTSYERLTMADALVTCSFHSGEAIIHQGDFGNDMYILLEGEVIVYQDKYQMEKEVTRLRPPAYFGELALLLNQPRAATIRASEDVKCLKLDRRSFNRLLGPCEEILKRNMETYNQFVHVTNE